MAAGGCDDRAPLPRPVPQGADQSCHQHHDEPPQEMTIDEANDGDPFGHGGDFDEHDDVMAPSVSAHGLPHEEGPVAVTTDDGNDAQDAPGAARALRGATLPAIISVMKLVLRRNGDALDPHSKWTVFNAVTGLFVKATVDEIEAEGRWLREQGFDDYGVRRGRDRGEVGCDLAVSDDDAAARAEGSAPKRARHGRGEERNDGDMTGGRDVAVHQPPREEPRVLPPPPALLAVHVFRDRRELLAALRGSDGGHGGGDPPPHGGGDAPRLLRQAAARGFSPPGKRRRLQAEIVRGGTPLLRRGPPRGDQHGLDRAHGDGAEAAAAGSRDGRGNKRPGSHLESLDAGTQYLKPRRSTTTDAPGSDVIVSTANKACGILPSTRHRAGVPCALTMGERGTKRPGGPQLILDGGADMASPRNIDDERHDPREHDGGPCSLRVDKGDGGGGETPAPRLVRKRLRTKTRVAVPVMAEAVSSAGICAPSSGITTTLSASPLRTAGERREFENS